MTSAAEIEKMPLSELTRAWRARIGSGSHSLATDRAFAKRALTLGEPLLAHDICRVALGLHDNNKDNIITASKDLLLRQHYGLALARCGSMQAAQRVMQALYDEGARDEETLGILARTYKDAWLRERGRLRKQQALTECIARYQQAWSTTAGNWTGINVASLLAITGRRDEARAVAQKVLEQCRAEASARKPDYWARATMGEAHLVLGDRKGAAHWYRLAHAASGGNFGDVASTRRQAMMLLGKSRRVRAWLDTVLPVPVVGVFCGQANGDQGQEGLDPTGPTAHAQRRAISRYIEQHRIGVGFTPAACPADILFLQAMQAAPATQSMAAPKRETRVVLPEPASDMARHHLAADGHWQWNKHLLRALKAADQVTVVSDDASSTVATEYAHLILLGMARSRARNLTSTVRAFTLADAGGSKALAQAGTATACWQELGEPFDAIDPVTGGITAIDTVRRPRRAGLMDTMRQDRMPKEYSQRFVSMLFADVAGFTKLRNAQVPDFVRHYMGEVGRLLKQCKPAPLCCNTWGDALYFCFASPQTAASFALALCHKTEHGNWETKGLPADLRIRIALHCGPAFKVIDPVINQLNYTGWHVSRAARMEAITPPNTVYASEPFVAIAECLRIPRLAVEYAGNLPLAKDYGSFPMYSVKRG